jgi:hypothetical protein
MYLAAVDRAVAEPNCWIEIPRRFDTEFNARITGSCLSGGYLRVQPREGDVAVLVQGKRCIETAAPMTAFVEQDGDAWMLRIRYES